MARGLRGVRDDLTELGRHLAGIACFLHPLLPPTHAITSDSPSFRSSSHRSSLSTEIASDGDVSSSEAQTAPPPPVLSESSRGGGNCEEDSGAGAIPDEVIEVVRNLAQLRDAWMEFPAPEPDDDLTISCAQREHIAAVEQHVPDLLGLHQDLVPSYMSEELFWKIYFSLLRSKLTEGNLELLQSQQDQQPRYHTYLQTRVSEIESEEGSQQEDYPRSSETHFLPPGPNTVRWMFTKSQSQRSMDQWSEIPSDVDSFQESRVYVSSEESSDVDGASVMVMEKYAASTTKIRSDQHRRKPPISDRRKSSNQQPNPAAELSKKGSWQVIEDSEFELLDSS